MEYGLWETTLAFFVLIVGAIVAWRLPNILTVIKDWKKQQSK
ncbi:hypothetical protein [Lonepinella sp. BR2474]